MSSPCFLGGGGLLLPPGFRATDGYPLSGVKPGASSGTTSAPPTSGERSGLTPQCRPET